MDRGGPSSPTFMTPPLHTADLDGIPLLWARPAGEGPRPLVLWLHAFSWSKEDVVPQLIDLASRGFIALSWDLPQHGARSLETRDTIKRRVRADLRRHFWPILAQGADEAPRIIDWALAHLDIQSQVAIGGISMGGDIAVAAAGIDQRIDRVAVALATPDWLRPGSNEPQGTASETEWEFYRRFNPLTNLQHYAHRPAMAFACGADDRQVPPEGADTFVQALSEIYADCPERLAVAREPETAHRFTPWMWNRTLKWLGSDRGH
jgi:dienelactone hydrolase